LELLISLTVYYYTAAKIGKIFYFRAVFAFLFQYYYIKSLLLLSLRLPSARIKAAAGSSVGCGRFSIVCPAATLPIEGKAARGLLSWPWPLLLSPMGEGSLNT
jgi:hypothetical protein